MNDPERGERQSEEPQVERKEPGRSSLGGAREDSLDAQSQNDRYKIAEEIFLARIEQMQQRGEMIRLSEVADEEELDERFDQMNRVYRRVCLEMGLPWLPPLNRDTD